MTARGFGSKDIQSKGVLFVERMLPVYDFLTRMKTASWYISKSLYHGLYVSFPMHGIGTPSNSGYGIYIA